MFIDIDGLEGGVPKQVYEFGYYVELKVSNAVDNLNEFINAVGRGIGNMGEGYRQWVLSQTYSSIPGMPTIGNSGPNQIEEFIGTVHYVKEIPDIWREGGVEERSQIVLSVGLTAASIYLAGKSFKANFKSASIASNSTRRADLLNTKGLSIWKDAESTAYLNSVGGEAAYMSLEDGSGIMIFRENVSRPAYLEEIIHHNQKLKHGEEYFLRNRNLLEVEAQEELLMIGKEEGWTQGEMDEIGRAQKSWQKKLDDEVNGNRSNTGR